MSKDPAFLFYYKDFDNDTASWEAESIGWYIRLLCYQAGNGELPSDLEEIAQIARVKFSEFQLFSERWACRLASKFAINDNGKLYNKKLSTIQENRKIDAVKSRKKSILSILGNYIKYNNLSEETIQNLKENFNHNDFISIVDEQDRKNAILTKIDEIITKSSLSDTLSDTLIYVNENVNESINIKEKKFNFKKSLLDFGFDEKLVDDWLEVRKKLKAVNTETAYNSFIAEVKKINSPKNVILKHLVTNSWKGLKASWNLDFEEKENISVNQKLLS